MTQLIYDIILRDLRASDKYTPNNLDRLSLRYENDHEKEESTSL